MRQLVLIFVALFATDLILSQPAQEVAFIKYFRTDQDFVAGNTMLATERGNQAHLLVSYNENKLPLLKSWIDASDRIVKEVSLEYDEEKKLIRRAFLNDSREVKKVIQYGMSEPWSREFRTFAFPKTQQLSFGDQQTIFNFDESGQINEIRFLTVDMMPYGRITLSYDHLGFLQHEIWRTLPDETVIRQFKYSYDIMTDVQQIWEYDTGAEPFSHVALQMAPADQLYKTPPPRTGNILDEVAIIMNEIRARRIITPIPAFVPKNRWDTLLFKSGEELRIEYISRDSQGIKFRLPDEKEILTVPLVRVVSLTSQWGEQLFPEPE